MGKLFIIFIFNILVLFFNFIFILFTIPVIIFNTNFIIFIAIIEIPLIDFLIVAEGPVTVHVFFPFSFIPCSNNFFGVLGLKYAHD
ncbi:hypothetical protein BJ944DRAFT_273119 [Cunninghamella echinulata]|nr:hypothetical protein BJ944DRAFT_273119 [Cunninghamella echinulata]